MQIKTIYGRLTEADVRLAAEAGYDFVQHVTLDERAGKILTALIPLDLEAARG